MRIVEVESLVPVEYPTRSVRRATAGLDEDARKIVTVTVKLECTMDEWNAFCRGAESGRLLG